MQISPEQYRAARAWLGLNQAALGSECGVGDRLIYAAEHGEYGGYSDRTALIVGLDRLGVSFAKDGVSGNPAMTPLRRHLSPRQSLAARAWLDMPRNELADEAKLPRLHVQFFEKEQPQRRGSFWRETVDLTPDFTDRLSAVFESRGLRLLFNRFGQAIGIAPISGFSLTQAA